MPCKYRTLNPHPLQKEKRKESLPRVEIVMELNAGAAPGDRLPADGKMQLTHDVKNDIKAARKIRLPWWAVLCLIIGGVPICWLFDHFGTLDTALPTLMSIAVLALAIAVKWKLRRRAWFWITMAILAALHVLLILFVPWTSKWVRSRDCRYRLGGFDCDSRDAFRRREIRGRVEYFGRMKENAERHARESKL